MKRRIDGRSDRPSAADTRTAPASKHPSDEEQEKPHESTAMITIRPMHVDDLPALAELHLEGRPRTASAVRRARIVFERLWPALFFSDADGSNDSPGLVAVDPEGRIRGMIGIARRPLQLHGHRLTAAIGVELYVAPAARSSLLGVQLLRHYLRQHAALAVADLANASTTHLWLRLGGFVATKYCWNWWRPLAPVRSLLSLGERWAGRPAARWPLKALRRVAGSCARLRGRQHDDRFAFAALEPARWAELAERTFDRLAGRPVYGPDLCGHLWDRLDFLYRDIVRTHAVEVRDRRNETLGWFLLHETESGIGRVSQFGATERRADALLAGLHAFALQRGISILQGVWNPVYEEALRRFGVLCQPRRTAFLVASNRPEVAAAFRHGEVFWSLLEGEGPLQVWNRSQASMGLSDDGSAASTRGDLRPGCRPAPACPAATELASTGRAERPDGTGSDHSAANTADAAAAGNGERLATATCCRVPASHAGDTTD
ncbi:MAG: hypothetical protein D6725_09825 [Planctomycetota bacterium]|nr:MAG: hypothetical protein D6725_09825 [Planctomycetota bacterium]